ncbi:hypothetical protein B0A49_01999 [Cryomyces minteri]|uniref:Uncharacterized protein n=1 Tax=Cryomyces minteri TaxID=331657 RepID=A0A4U0XTX3_9PEZI|nr:hypothetical protein B0A49_01999 [Cryomyces minteri]
MATAHPTSPVPGPAVLLSPYIHPVIQEMLTALTTDSYSKLLDTLMDVETRMAVDSSKSRLLYIADSSDYAMWLLCSIPKRALIALLDGTFFEKLKYDRDWRDVDTLHPVVIFRPAYWQMAAIGESMLSQLAGSYGSYGGFNLTQAGLSVSSAMLATVSDWNHIQTNLAALGIFDIAKQNSGDEARELEDRVTKAKALIRADELRAKVKAIKLELVALEDDLARAEARKEDSYRRLDNELDKVEKKIERRAELRRVLELERSCLDGLKRVSLRDWNAKVALLESKGK